MMQASLDEIWPATFLPKSALLPKQKNGSREMLGGPHGLPHVIDALRERHPPRGEGRANQAGRSLPLVLISFVVGLLTALVQTLT